MWARSIKLLKFHYFPTDNHITLCKETIVASRDRVAITKNKCKICERLLQEMKVGEEDE